MDEVENQDLLKAMEEFEGSQGSQVKKIKLDSSCWTFKIIFTFKWITTITIFCVLCLLTLEWNLKRNKIVKSKIKYKTLLFQNINFHYYYDVYIYL